MDSLIHIYRATLGEKGEMWGGGERGWGRGEEWRMAREGGGDLGDQEGEEEGSRALLLPGIICQFFPTVELLDALPVPSPNTPGQD